MYRKEIGATPKSRNYIYVFRGKWENPLWVKIGETNNIYRRLKEHRTAASPFGLEVIAVVKVRNSEKAESIIHSRFSKERIQTYTGTEWFWYSFRIVCYFLLVKDYHITKTVKEKF